MISFFHPNKSIKGFGCSFWELDGSVFATLIKQSGIDPATGNGLFKGNVEGKEGKVNIKLNKEEVAGILDCIERNRSFSRFHDADESPKSITFSPWMEKPNPNAPNDKVAQRGFSFSITVTNKQDISYKNSFYIGLNFAEARLIREYLSDCLRNQFAAYRNYKPATKSNS